MRETALAPAHRALGARMVPFAGWRMPVAYGKVLDEVRAVRTAAGLFDLGHMGRVRIEGGDAQALLQRVQTNDVSGMRPGAIRYALILDDRGLTQDDVLVYRDPGDGGFFVVVNAANADRDLGILREAAAGFGDVRIEDVTDELGMFAIQGPAAQRITAGLTDVDLDGLRYYHWTSGSIAGVPAWLSRTGYTGEDGFEIYAPNEKIPDLWDAFLTAGREHGLRPAGLGARDTLRLEAGMPLYGHEIDETTNPLEAGLGFAVKFDHDFVGRPALERIVAQGGTGRRLVGLVTDSPRVPRQGYDVFDGNRKVGSICSGTASPTLGRNIATAYVAEDAAEPGRRLTFAVRERREPAVVTKLPFYKRPR